MLNPNEQIEDEKAKYVVYSIILILNSNFLNFFHFFRITNAFTKQIIDTLRKTSIIAIKKGKMLIIPSPFESQKWPRFRGHYTRTPSDTPFQKVHRSFEEFSGSKYQPRFMTAA